ncbi:MAG: hypothetical protein AB7G88_03395 [Thermomicrobiales bacterium]
MGVRYRWQGVRNPGERGWQEWFPGRRGLPPRDLTDEDVAELTTQQREILESGAGRRLYVRVLPGDQDVTGSAGESDETARVSRGETTRDGPAELDVLHNGDQMPETAESGGDSDASGSGTATSEGPNPSKRRRRKNAAAVEAGGSGDGDNGPDPDR